MEIWKDSHEKFASFPSSSSWKQRDDLGNDNLTWKREWKDDILNAYRIFSHIFVRLQYCWIFLQFCCIYISESKIRFSISAVYIQWAIVRSKIYILRILRKTGKFCYQYIERRTIIVDELYIVLFFAFFFYLQKLRIVRFKIRSPFNVRSVVIREFFFSI